MAPILTVTPREPELIVPSQSTPHEIKTRSEIDDQESFRCHYPVFMFYKRNPSMEGLDPVDVIRGGLAKTLVYYYPCAGRLVEGHDHKLRVGCTAQGVLFREAEADFSLEQLCREFQPPRWCPELLIRDVPGSDGIVGCPLMLVQVTRLKCGGWVLAVRFSHVMVDALGALRFLTAMTEMAKGASAPSILPVWERELLSARRPPCVTQMHPEYEVDSQSVIPSGINDKHLVTRSFTFGPKEIGAIRNKMPIEMRSSSKYDLITACIWRSRTRALQFNPDDNVRITCMVSMYGTDLLDLPMGYYGNAVICPARVSKVKTLCNSPVEYAIKLVKEAKAQVTREYARSTIDFIATEERPKLINPWNLIVSNTSRTGFDKVDFGWGKPTYGGSMHGKFSVTSCTGYRNEKGEDVMVAPMVLPATAMERFEEELRKLIWGGETIDKSNSVTGPSKL